MNINLRKLEKTDLEVVRAWRNSEDVSKYMYTSQTISKENQIKWYEKNQGDNTSEYWMIEYDGKQLGLASITQISRVFDSCYWAFYLGDTSVRGAGIGSKVEYTIINYVFKELNLNKLCCEVFSFNEKVIAMHEKFGFRREAYYRSHVKKNEKYYDVVGLALLRKEWNQIESNLKLKIYGIT